MIKIKAEKIIVQGEQKYKLKELIALEKEELPKEYSNSKNGVWIYADGNQLVTRTSEDSYNRYMPDEIITANDFVGLTAICKKAGNRLQKINARLAKENAGWEGSVEIII